MFTHRHVSGRSALLLGIFLCAGTTGWAQSSSIGKPVSTELPFEDDENRVVWPTLPPAGTPPVRTEPLYIYYEGPQVIANDPLWALKNTRFQIRCDVRQTSQGWWAGNNFPGDVPADPTNFRPYAGPVDFAQQVVNRLSNAYATANTWPAGKAKKHGFELIGPNGQASPWRDIDNPRDYIPYGGDLYTFTCPTANVDGPTQTITSSGLLKYGPEVWAASTVYGQSIWDPYAALGAGYAWNVKVGGVSGANPPVWLDSNGNPFAEVQDGSVTWRRVELPTVMLRGFDNAANNGIYTVARKPTSMSIKVTFRFGAGGDPAHVVTETNATNVKVHTLFGPDVWRAAGRVGSADIAADNFKQTLAALQNASLAVLPADIERAFVHYVEDDESISDVKPGSVTWYNTGPGGLAAGQTNLPQWRTQGYWQRIMTDPRVGTARVDGTYTVNQMLTRAALIINNANTLPDPLEMVSPWNPRQQTLRAWQWINTRSAQSIMAISRFEPFKRYFGDVPCGNWNQGVISGDPLARIIVEPAGGEASQGISIDNYQGANLWGMSIPALYNGVLGDYRGFDPNSIYFTDSPQWSTEANWVAEANARGFPITTPAGTISRHYQLGELALRQYAASVKRNYGYGHEIMPSLWMYHIVSVSDLTERKWIIHRLSKALGKAYMDGLIDKVWAFCPGYADQTPAGTAEREGWYQLSGHLLRRTSKSADYNFSGSVTVQDYFDYSNMWFAQDPYADFNDDGQITIDDLFQFLAAWNAQL